MVLSTSSDKAGNGTLVSPVDEANAIANAGPEKAPKKIKYSRADRKRYECQQLLFQDEVTPQPGTPKRFRSDGSTPVQDREVKRSRVVNPGHTYILALESQVKLAIVSEGFPQGKLNSKQEMAIEEVFEIKIAEINSGHVIPRFEHCRHKNNLLTVICSDEMSKAWLFKAAGDLKEWECAIGK